MMGRTNRKNMKVVKQNVLVKPFKSDEKSTGGIYVPESARQVNNKMIVVAVGEGSAKNPMRLKPGDVVFRVKDAGRDAEFIIDGESHFVMPQSYFLAKLKDE